MREVVWRDLLIVGTFKGIIVMWEVSKMEELTGIKVFPQLHAFYGGGCMGVIRCLLESITKGIVGKWRLYGSILWRYNTGGTSLG